MNAFVFFLAVVFLGFCEAGEMIPLKERMIYAEDADGIWSEHIRFDYDRWNVRSRRLLYLDCTQFRPLKPFPADSNQRRTVIVDLLSTYRIEILKLGVKGAIDELLGVHLRRKLNSDLTEPNQKFTPKVDWNNKKSMSEDLVELYFRPVKFARFVIIQEDSEYSNSNRKEILRFCVIEIAVTPCVGGHFAPYCRNWKERNAIAQVPVSMATKEIGGVKFVWIDLQQQYLVFGITLTTSQKVPITVLVGNEFPPSHFYERQALCTFFNNPEIRIFYGCRKPIFGRYISIVNVDFSPIDRTVTGNTFYGGTGCYKSKYCFRREGTSTLSPGNISVNGINATVHRSQFLPSKVNFEQPNVTCDFEDITNSTAVIKMKIGWNFGFLHFPVCGCEIALEGNIRGRKIRRKMTPTLIADEMDITVEDLLPFVRYVIKSVNLESCLQYRSFSPTADNCTNKEVATIWEGSGGGLPAVGSVLVDIPSSGPAPARVLSFAFLVSFSRYCFG